jgi:hypothetical protein
MLRRERANYPMRGALAPAMRDADIRIAASRI